MSESNPFELKLESLRLMVKQLMPTHPHPIVVARDKRLRKNNKRIWNAFQGGWTRPDEFRFQDREK